MKRLLAIAAILLLGIAAGCSKDDNPTGSKPPVNAATSTWIDSGYWRTTLDASSGTVFMGFSFATRFATPAASLTGASTDWSMAFRRDIIKLNGGTSSTSNGDCEGANLGVLQFTDVTIADTVGASWVTDAIEYFINNWYNYDPNTHSLSANRNVYSMVDAEGDNYIKFQIDSLVGAGMPPNMGTVYMTYFYQATASSTDLSGTLSHAVIPVNSGTAYFDFSSGSVVTPATPSNSTEWDLAFSAYDIKQNSGPNGTGHCAAFYAYTELADPTDIASFTTQPAAPMFTDNPSSAFLDWYNYTGAPLHQLLSKGNVYLVRTGGKVYKVKIESYYANIGGTPTSGWYTFVWKEL